jgi:diketogulonate reductase-like aldo/keto reductase
MEEFVPGRVRALGVSNVSLPILKRIFDSATIKPAFVQNRFIPELAFDHDLRGYCKSENIDYQAFRVLKGNPSLLTSSIVKDAAAIMNVSQESMLYFLVLHTFGVHVLNGSIHEVHVLKDMIDFNTLQTSITDKLSAEDWSKRITSFREVVETFTSLDLH